MVDKMTRVIHVPQETNQHMETPPHAYLHIVFLFLPCHAITIASNIRFGNADHQIHRVILIRFGMPKIRIRIHRKRPRRLDIQGSLEHKKDMGHP